MLGEKYLKDSGFIQKLKLNIEAVKGKVLLFYFLFSLK